MMRKLRARTVLAGLSALVAVAGLGACGSSSHSAAPSSSAGTTGGGNEPAPAAQPANSATGAPITVGLICGCTGAYAAGEGSGAQMYKAWVNTVNASGGLNGHPVKLITKDDGGIPGTSLSDAQELVSDHVIAVVDDSVYDSAWAKLFDSAKIPIVGGVTPAESFYTDPNFYIEGQTGDSAVYATVATAKQAGATNMGVVYCAESPSCSTIVAAVKASGKQLGLPVAYSAAISATAPNYTAQCIAAQQAHATALLVFDVSQPIINLANDCHAQGYNPVYVTEGAGFGMNQASPVGLKNSLWTEYSILPFWANTPGTRAMNAAADKYYPGLRTNKDVWQTGSEFGWAAGLLLQAAVKASGLTSTQTPTSAVILKGLESLHGDTLDGFAPPLTFQAGKPHLIHCWFTGRIHNGTPVLQNNGRPTCQNGSAS